MRIWASCSEPASACGGDRGQTRRVPGRVALALACAVLLLAGGPSAAKVLVTVDDALRLAFPEAAIERQAVFLTEAELTAASAEARETVGRALVVRYVARRAGQLAGTAYLDVHRVRTLEETLLVVVAPDGTIGRVEVLSFDEPLDYLPRDAWYDQFAGRRLNDELRLDRGIRAVTGATLTAMATTAAARRVLALHGAIERRTSAP